MLAIKPSALCPLCARVWGLVLPVLKSTTPRGPDTCANGWRFAVWATADKDPSDGAVCRSEPASCFGPLPHRARPVRPLELRAVRCTVNLGSLSPRPAAKSTVPCLQHLALPARMSLQTRPSQTSLDSAISTTLDTPTSPTSQEVECSAQPSVYHEESSDFGSSRNTEYPQKIPQTITKGRVHFPLHKNILPSSRGAYTACPSSRRSLKTK